MRKLVNKYDMYKRREGTYNEGDSMTDKTQAEDTEIYKCIEKYGITSLMRQTMAQEPLYLDNRNRDMSLLDAVNIRKEMDEYFEQMPARARKVFGDNPEIFYQKYKSGDFNDMLQVGALTNEQVYIMEEQNNEKMVENNISNTEINTNDSKLDNNSVQGN